MFSLGPQGLPASSYRSSGPAWPTTKGRPKNQDGTRGSDPPGDDSLRHRHPVDYPGRPKKGPKQPPSASRLAPRPSTPVDPTGAPDDAPHSPSREGGGPAGKAE